MQRWSRCSRGSLRARPRVAHDWAAVVDKIKGNPAAASHLLKDGVAPRVGEVMRFTRCPQNQAAAEPVVQYQGALR